VADRDHLAQTRQALIHLENALMHLRHDYDARRLSPANFALMAEPIIEDIRTLRRQIEDAIGFTLAVATMADPAIAPRLDDGSISTGSPASPSEASAGTAQHVG
jgi:hypothetical protein